MMYALLLYGDENVGPQPGSEEFAEEMKEWFVYTQAVEEAGVMRGGEALQPEAAATTVRVRDGKTVIAEGPFAETKEALGGFYLIDVEDLDAAISWAERIPSVGYGSVEVRPVMDTSELPGME
ncbi:MAG: YciI family protein [Actinomycetota bacterium]